MVSAQSWQGLGADDDERNRISATADGGIWVMQTPYPEPLSQLAGTEDDRCAGTRTADTVAAPLVLGARAWAQQPANLITACNGRGRHCRGASAGRRVGSIHDRPGRFAIFY